MFLSIYNNKKMLFHCFFLSLIILFSSPAFCLTPEEITEDLFPDDGSEISYTIRRAFNAYEEASSIDPDSVATLNNLGVLYLLLEDYDNAETYFDSALDISINDLNGSAGIVMNQGVLNSDLNLLEEAEQLYTDASSMVTDNIDSSVLISQLNYNRAWDAFDNDNYEDAMDFVNATLDNENTGSLLRAKSFALRGATYYQQGNNELAKLDLIQAITTDPYGVEGPIALLAAENLSNHIVNIDINTPNHWRVLIDDSEHIIKSGSVEYIYGCNGTNNITIESGAGAKLINFSGNNTITIRSDTNLFIVFRSGATVTFEGFDGTVLKLPATADRQTIIFNDINKDLVIENNQVMLDAQVINTDPAII